MLTSFIAVLPLLATSFFAGSTNADVYWPDQIVELGQLYNKPMGVTSSPNIQSKTSQYAIEAQFCLPALPANSTCTLGFFGPGKWNDTNSTWSAWLPQSPQSTYLRIDVLDGDMNPNEDTFSRPSNGSYYAKMGLTIPGENETGLNVSMDPPTVPCSASFSIWPMDGEIILTWSQGPSFNTGLQMLVTSPSP